MSALLEVWTPAGPQLVPLSTEQVSIGRALGNTVVLEHDPLVGRLHAVIEPVGAGWCVRDLGSRNGTYLTGERILGDRALRHGDELRIGQTRIVYRAVHQAHDTPTMGGERPPELTRRERDVLRALCRPLFTSQLFAEPASMREIAAELVVTEAAVKQHLLRLYDKFALYDDTVRRRVLLANEAVRRGAVTLADLRPES